VTEERPVRKGDEVADEGLGRLLALTDGVFAIALTLLVIQIALPEGTSDVRLGAALVALGPHYFAYVLSFAVSPASGSLTTSHSATSAATTTR
jgi:TMEM175 potassium channel family protein